MHLHLDPTHHSLHPTILFYQSGELVIIHNELVLSLPYHEGLLRWRSDPIKSITESIQMSRAKFELFADAGVEVVSESAHGPSLAIW